MNNKPTPQPELGAPLKRILSGKVPVYIIHRGAQFQNRIPEVFTGLAASSGTALGLGTVAKMQSMAPKSLSEYLGGVGVPLRIADPELFRRADSGWDGFDTTRERKRALPWRFYDNVPTKPDRTWIGTVIQSQYDSGATVALSATGWVDATKANIQLANAMAFVNASRQVVQNDPMFVNLTLDYRWLTDKELRGMLLQEIVESSEKHWYLRFWWPIITVRYGQLLDPDVLRGYRILARTAALEGKRLYLPNSGLTGWISTSLGATGFSTGTSWPDQAFARQRPMGGRKGQKPPPHTPRMFDRSILHTVDHTVFERLLSQSGHRPFPTSFSSEIAATGHTKELAGLHYLESAGNLQAKLAGKDPTITVEKAVRRGTRFLDSLDPLDKPTGGNSPVHLNEWTQLLN